MKKISALFLLLGIIVAGCANSPEEDLGLDGEEDVVAEDSNSEVVEAVSQALDSNCSERTCVSCGAGKFQTKVVKYRYSPPPKTCSTYIDYVTYGPCLSYCAL